MARFLDRFLRALAVTAGVGVAGSAWAAAPPDNTLFAGFVKPKLVTGNAPIWCGIDRNDTTFIKRVGNQAAQISFAGINYTRTGSRGGEGAEAYYLNGQARLGFSNATSGRIYFDANADYPTSIYRPEFNAYSAVYNPTARTLTIKFTILLPGCTLPVEAVYRN
jgi:hypothetical protein